MESVIKTNGLSVSLGTTEILHDVSIHVPSGAMVGLIGPNGSGKTTLLRTLAGLLSYRGRAVLFDREIEAWPRRELAQRLAFVRQFQTLPFDFRVEELVLLGRTPRKRLMEGYSSQDVRDAARFLEELEVASLRRRSVQQLSGGELQRVLLAQALVQEADVLLLDEPTAHLDVHHQFSFLTAVRRQVDARRTVLAVFHDLELAARYSDHLIVLHEGHSVAAGSPSEVLSPDLLSTIFRMEADVSRGGHGEIRIDYHRPVSPPADAIPMRP
jgi:iron complex transport system ATP-binding protein